MSLEPQYVPINGKEGREVLKREICRRIDQMPMMKEGTSYHKFKADGIITISAYPSDTPVPELDFKALTIEPKEAMPDSFKTTLDQITFIESTLVNAKKRVERLEATLNTIRPAEVIDLAINAGDKPDELRLANDMPITMIKRDSSGISEVKVPAAQVKVGG